MQNTQGLTEPNQKTFLSLQLLGAGLIFALLCDKNWTTFHFDVVVDGALILLIATFLLAGFILRVGQDQFGSVIISANLSSLALGIAAVTGGLHSFIVPWLLVLPVSTIFFRKTNGVAIASSLSVFGLIGLYVGEIFGLLPEPNVPISEEHTGLYLVSLATALIYASAHAICSVKHWTDVEKRASHDENCHRLITESTTQLVSAHNCEGEAELVSAAAKALFGVDPHEVSGATFIEMIHEPDRDAFINACNNATKDQIQTTLEIRFKTEHSPHSAHFPAQCEFQSYTGDLFADPVCIVLTQDITAKKEQVAVLRDAHAAAQQADEAKNQLLANVTHELRTPLNSILGFSDILESELGEAVSSGDVAALGEYVNLINESGAHLLQVVNDLLDVSTMEAGQYSLTPETMELTDLLGSSSRMVEPFALASKIKLRLEVPQDLGKVQVDKRAFRQIIFNLVSNAVKFSNPGSTVTLGAGRGKHSATIWVEDEGIGISKRDLDRLGEPFFQVDTSDGRSFGGAGLGLSVVKGLVDIHGGSTSIESEPGTGTTVRIYLPLGAEDGDDQNQKVEAIDDHSAALPVSLAHIS